jgi:hypothetical protein
MLLWRMEEPATDWLTVTIMPWFENLKAEDITQDQLDWAYEKLMETFDGGSQEIIAEQQLKHLRQQDGEAFETFFFRARTLHEQADPHKLVDDSKKARSIMSGIESNLQAKIRETKKDPSLWELFTIGNSISKTALHVNLATDSKVQLSAHDIIGKTAPGDSGESVTYTKSVAYNPTKKSKNWNKRNFGKGKSSSSESFYFTNTEVGTSNGMENNDARRIQESINEPETKETSDDEEESDDSEEEEEDDTEVTVHLVQQTLKGSKPQRGKPNVPLPVKDKASDMIDGLKKVQFKTAGDKIVKAKKVKEDQTRIDSGFEKVTEKFDKLTNLLTCILEKQQKAEMAVTHANFQRCLTCTGLGHFASECATERGRKERDRERERQRERNARDRSRDESRDSSSDRGEKKRSRTPDSENESSRGQGGGSRGTKKDKQ